MSTITTNKEHLEKIEETRESTPHTTTTFNSSSCIENIIEEIDEDNDDDEEEEEIELWANNGLVTTTYNRDENNSCFNEIYSKPRIINNSKVWLQQKQSLSINESDQKQRKNSSSLLFLNNHHLNDNGHTTLMDV